MASNAEENEADKPTEANPEDNETPGADGGEGQKSEAAEKGDGEGEGDEGMEANESKAAAEDTEPKTGDADDAESKAADAGDAESKAADDGEAKSKAADAGDAASKASDAGDAESKAADAGDAESKAADDGEAESKAADDGDAESKAADEGEEDKTGSGDALKASDMDAAASKVSAQEEEDADAKESTAARKSSVSKPEGKSSELEETDKISETGSKEEVEGESRRSRGASLAKKSRSVKPRRRSDQLPTETQARATRSLGAKEYVKKKRASTRGESEEPGSSPRMSEVDPQQRISMLSEHTMEELSQKPRSHAPPPSRKSSILTRKQIADHRAYGSKLISTSDLEMGGTRMSTLTEYLKRKQMAARARSIQRDLDDSMHRAFPDGRPSLYEQYTKYTDDRINELSQYFTPEQMMEYRDAFYNFDDDIDGFIPIGEVPFLMRALCQNPTEEELYEWISEVDVDSLGSIDFADFLTIMSKKVTTNPIGYEEVLKAFQTFDNHGNGFLCAKELAYLMTTFGETLSEEEMTDMLNEVTINEDYEVPYIEFAKKITDC